ncbi:MAG: hypothetical protein IPK82_26645 [Polyangiaceae bacterium]|nr:hypothetical protein [Polyangiaceae bacterium]
MTDGKRTFNAHLGPEAHAKPYQCLLEDSSWFDIPKTRELVHLLVEQYGGTKQTLKKWRKTPPFSVTWFDRRAKPPTQRRSVEITFDKLVEHIMERRGIDHQSLDLTAPEHAQDNWMDSDVTWWGHYLPINEVPETFTTIVELPLGPDFPVVPGIEREGFVTSSPQLHLQRALLAARSRVLREAPLFVPQVIDRDRGQHVQMIIGGTPPLAGLIEFLSLYVTILDITLMQAYYAGFYASSKTKLKFDKDVMGPATGRRVIDKIRWVRALSGQPLNAQTELTTFNRMKAVRNHFTHFDPPCLAVSIDDVAEWLSNTPVLAWLLIKIRRCLGVPISGPLVQLAMAPRVLPVARDPQHERRPQPTDAGYLSSTWRGAHPHAGRDPLRVPERLLSDLDELSRRAARVFGRDCTTGELIEALLTHQLAEMKQRDDQYLSRELWPHVRKAKNS